MDEFAGQIKIARIATRAPIHQPDIINDKFIKVISTKRNFKIEIATQINHSSELFPEVRDAYKRILDVVPIIYNQTVLLSGVNDTYEELIELFDEIRYLGVENHYFFHCVPIGGLGSFRIPLSKALMLARQVSQSGQISGRIKPKFALMTGIGKITLYDGTILDRKENRYLLRSEYLYNERIKWNPSYVIPKNAFVDTTGHLCIWYEDTEV